MRSVDEGASGPWSVFDSAVSAIAVSDASGELVYVNEAACQLWGFDDRDALIGREVSSLWSAGDAARAAAEQLGERGEWAGLAVVRCRDGCERLVRVSAVTVDHPSGRAVWTYMDQMDLPHPHSQLRVEEARLRALFDRAPVGMFDVGPFGEIRRVNRSLCEVVGRSYDQVLGADLNQFIHPDERALARERIVELATTSATSTEFTCRVLRPDGALRWVEVRLTAVPADGERSLVGVLRDVTTERKAREALALSEARFRVIAEQVESAFWLARADYSEVLYLSPAAERIWGLPRQALVDDPSLWMERVHAEDRDWVIAAHLESPTRYAHRHRIVRPEGEVRWVSVRVVPVQSMDGVVVGVAVDVTDNVLAERAREAAYSELADSAAENEMLLHEVHHRVKNNLQVISSMLALADQRESAAASTVLADSRARVLAMALVHESLYASGQFHAVALRTYVPRLLDQLVSVWQEHARGLEIHVHTDAVSLGVDRAIPLGLVLNELVTNALKHAFVCRGPSGRLSVSVRLLPAGELELEVTDDGCGFQKDRVAGGTLGLSITNALVGQLDGTLEITSEGGTCVRVRIPLVDRGAGGR